MRIAVVSDAHGARRWMDALLDVLPPVDALFFLGDMDHDAEYLCYGLAEKQPKADFLLVAGNNDPFSKQPRTVERTIEGVRMLITHGHLFRGIRSARTSLAVYAQRRGCGLVLYGHTHVTRDEQVDGVRLVNPGALMDGKWALATLQDGQAEVIHMALQADA